MVYSILKLPRVLFSDLMEYDTYLGCNVHALVNNDAHIMVTYLLYSNDNV